MQRAKASFGRVEPSLRHCERIQNERVSHRLRSRVGRRRRLDASWLTRTSQDPSRLSVIVEEEEGENAYEAAASSTSKTPIARNGKGATYFNQEHEFRIEFNHLVQLSVDDEVDEDEYEEMEIDTVKCVAGRGALNRWITNPKLLLIASYGEDNVHEVVNGSGSGSGSGRDASSREKSVWCVTLPKVKIFSWTVVPSFDISATVEENGVVFTSDRIVLDGIGIPDSLRNTKLEFSLYSHLYVEDETDLEKAPVLSDVSSSSTMVAQNALTLGVYLPRGLSRLPGVKRTGNIIVRTILNSVDRTAKTKLLKSFQEYIKSNVQTYV